MATVNRKPEHERLRQGELDLLELDPLAETAYIDLKRLAADMLQTPMALISLIDGDRQWFKSRFGLEITGSSPEIAFCAQAVHQPGEVFVIEDARLDPRFAAARWSQARRTSVSMPQHHW